MKKIFGLCLGVFCWFSASVVNAAEKFDILPDLPEPLQAAQATAVTTTDTSSNIVGASQAIGQEPNWFTMIFSLIFVVLLIYATGIIVTRLNKLGISTLKQQMGNSYNEKANVISTTHLGSNKTLHVVELDGKRMLIGASSTSIHLIKDLGTYPPQDIEEGEYSKIEIPNIRIPKIEIPKIEFPNIGFTKASPRLKTKTESEDTVDDNSDNNVSNNEINIENNGFEISEIYEEGPDGIIDKLFHSSKEVNTNTEEDIVSSNEHKVDPEEYALYKKYL